MQKERDGGMEGREGKGEPIAPRLRQREKKREGESESKRVIALQQHLMASLERGRE